jgi:hypothetical protein
VVGIGAIAAAVKARQVEGHEPKQHRAFRAVEE